MSQYERMMLKDVDVVILMQCYCNKSTPSTQSTYKTTDIHNIQSLIIPLLSIVTEETTSAFNCKLLLNHLDNSIFVAQ